MLTDEFADRASLIYLAKLAEQSERYSDMADAMAKVSKMEAELNDEERNLLSVAYKNIVGAHRTSWRVIIGVEHKCRDDESRVKVNNALKNKVRDELMNSCNAVDDLLKDALIPNAKSIESKVFMLKMRGDYRRYVCEIAQESEKAKFAETAAEFYEEAYKLSQQLTPANPIRLGLALNYSVFFYEIKEDAKKACNLAKLAFDTAISELDNKDEESPSSSSKDSTLIMQLLRDNLTLWCGDNPNYEEGAENEEVGEMEP